MANSSGNSEYDSGRLDSIHKDIKQHLTNEVLVRAFALDKVISIEQIYFDLDIRPIGQHSLENRDFKIAEFIDYGANIALMGEAGCGKTTALQYLASRLLNLGHDRLVIYASVYQIMQHALASNEHSIIAGLAGYLSQIENKIECHSLAQQLTSRPCVIILDGLDEAVHECEWIADAFMVFMRQFPLCQLITSSRYCIEFLNDRSFLKLIVQPLTPNQLNDFFYHWFADTPTKADALVKHLSGDQSLREMLTSPLSATILSVICQNGLPFNQATATVHRLRLDWLCGVFDHLKGIKRTRVEPSFLLDVAQVLAFAMHKRKMSSVNIAVAKQLCMNVYNQPYLNHKIELAITELISPTAVMVPSDLGGYDFGHINVQHYLASCELVNLRNERLSLLLNDPWWADVLMLYAQHTREIESIVNEACSMGVSLRVRKLVLNMLNCRPEKDQQLYRRKVDLTSIYDPANYY